MFGSIILGISSVYASASLLKIGQAFRLKGPPALRPEFSLSQTPRQGGKCGNQRTLDLVLLLPRSESEAWMANGNLATAEGPCQVLARPTENGKMEIRLSYKSPGVQYEMRTVELSTSENWILDHWIDKKLTKKAPLQSKNSPRKKQDSLDKNAPPKTILPGKEPQDLGALAKAFEDPASWEKILGASVFTKDLSSGELDRFRARVIERAYVPLRETIERLPLKLPALEIPGMSRSLSFPEETFDFPEFSLGEGREFQGAAQGLNFISALTQKGEYLKAIRAWEILEKSQFKKALPLQDPRYLALRGYLNLQLAQNLNDEGFKRRGLRIWEDALRGLAGSGGLAQEYLEYMMLESVRRLFESRQAYGALALLTWGQRFTWSARAEERFSFLKGEALMQLSLLDEAERAFSEYFQERSLIPLSSAIDRRLVPAAGFRVGDVLFMKKDFQRSANEYSRAMGAMPISNRFTFEANWYPDTIRQFPHVLYNRAEALTRLGNEQAALKDLRAFIFVAANHPQIGLVFYRVGDLLNQMGAESEQVLGAWRECVFRVPETIGARLCQARKSAEEMVRSKEDLWPRFIGDIENARPRPEDTATKDFHRDDLYTYTELILSDAFIRLGRGAQAMLRLDPLEKLEQTPYMRDWLDEYRITALSGLMFQKRKTGNYKEVISLYDKRKRNLFFRQTRPEILFHVAKAYEGLGLWKMAFDTMQEALRVRAVIRRSFPRPFDPAEEEWNSLKANLGLRLYADHKVSDAEIEAALATLNPIVRNYQRLWIEWAQLKNNHALEKKWWEQMERTHALDWHELSEYTKLLKELKEPNERLRVLNYHVGALLADIEKGKSSVKIPTASVFELFEARLENKAPEAALSVMDYLLTLSDQQLGPDFSRSMLAYRKGEVLRDLGRLTEARQSFERAKVLSPQGLWGKMATTAVKDLDSQRPSSEKL